MERENTPDENIDEANEDTPQIPEEVQQLLNNPAGIQKLLERKRSANAEAKGLREKYVAIEKEAQSLKEARQKQQEEAERAKLSEMEKLQKIIDDGQGKYAELEKSFSSTSQELKTLKIHNAALKLGAIDPEFIEFKYNKHLAALPEKERDSLDFSAWLSEFKEANIDAFGGTVQPGKTLGKPPQSPPPASPQKRERLPDNLLNPQTDADRKELERQMNEIIRR